MNRTSYYSAGGEGLYCSASSRWRGGKGELTRKGREEGRERSRENPFRQRRERSSQHFPSGKGKGGGSFFLMEEKWKGKRVGKELSRGERP